MPRVMEASGFLVTVLLLWVGASIYSEILEMHGHLESYFSRPLNYIEFPSLIMTFVALGLSRATFMGDSMVITERWLAFVTPGLWAAALLRLLTIEPNFGPLVLMVFKMVIDMVKWIVLMCVVLLGFAASLFVMFKGADLSEVLEDNCYELLAKLSTSFTFGFDFLWEVGIGAVSSEEFLGCVHKHPQWRGGLPTIYIFLALTVILLVNMLSAQPVRDR
eukprot:4703462-Prymnesium_polylepis.1